MKRIALLAILLVSLLEARSQIVTSEDFSNYNGKELIVDGNEIDYVESALHIKELYGLDKNNAITRTTIVEAPGKTKNQIYIDVNTWFIHTFNSGKSVIQLNEKEAGVVVGKGYIENVAQHVSFASSADIHAWVIIRVDIKDNKFRVMTTVQEYDMDMGAGVLGAMSSGMNGTPDQTTHVTWAPKDCFPFSGKKYKKTTSKAFVNCHIWSQVVINKLTEAVLNGITGTEEEW